MAKRDINLIQGDTLLEEYILRGSDKKPVDTTNWQILFQIRDTITDTVVAEAATVAGVNTNGTVTTVDAEGKITIEIPFAVTETFVIDKMTRHSYQLQVTYPTNVRETLMTGRVVLSKDGAAQ